MLLICWLLVDLLLLPITVRRGWMMGREEEEEEEEEREKPKV